LGAVKCVVEDILFASRCFDEEKERRDGRAKLKLAYVRGGGLPLSADKTPAELIQIGKR
jgi:hypothetical protein